MNNVHLNLGLRFAKPYESHYATIRRFYIANRGIPFSVCANVLRLKIPGTNRSSIHDGGVLIDFYQRIQALHPQHYKSNNALCLPYYASIDRNCPQCANNIYHTDLYCLIWLERCPIHHCHFVEHCPVCQKDWPSIKDMWKRDCPCCGSPSTKAITVKKNIKTNHAYQCIADIFRLIEYKNYNKKHLFGNDERYTDIGRSDGHTLIASDNARFAAFQSSYQPEFTASKLAALHIKATPPKIKVFKLERINKDRSEIDYERKCYTRNIDLSDNQKLIVLSDYAVMQRILLLLSKHINKKHQLHIISHRCITYEHLSNGPLPCLFCLALSLWFYNIASQKYGYDNWMDINEFPLLQSARFDSLLWVPDVEIYEDRDLPSSVNRTLHSYKISPKFTGWFYRRGLEIAFIEIFLFAQELLFDLQHGNSPKKRPKIIYPDQNYLTNRIQDRLLFVYEHDHPVEEITLPHTPYNDNICKTHHQYLKNTVFKDAYFDVIVPTAPFKLDDFYKIHQRFERYLKTRRYFSYPYMSPIFANQSEYKSLLEKLKEDRKRTDARLAIEMHKLKLEWDHSRYITGLKRIDHRFKQQIKTIEESFKRNNSP